MPLNSRLSVVEHAQMLAETGARILVFSPHLADRLDGLRLVSLGPVPGRDASRSALDLPAAKDDASPTDPMLLMHTSGTTGTLKAAQHTQASWAAAAANVLANLVNPGPDSTMLHAASLFHASGFFVLPYWVRGGTAAVLPKFDPDSYLHALARHRATEINLVPTMLGMLFASGAAEHADLSSLRTVVYGASPMPRPLIERALAAWGPRFVQYYGQSEAPLVITALDRDDHTEPSLLGCCGQPAVDAEVGVFDTDGQPVAPGEIGEIRVRAPFGMAGYYHAPDRNAETLTPDGWIRTRDLARADERGYLTLVDRSSDMIVTGGYNVYPREVEDALMAHPAVAEAAVVGAPDATWVEAVTAFVALRPGASVSELVDGGTVRLPRLIAQSRAMDLILTGRPIEAAEAERIGLVNRFVPAGQALAAAQQLAEQLAALPQTCLRRDRASILDAQGLDEAAALATEFRHGEVSLAADALVGARRFADGAGRHGGPATAG